MTERQHDDSLLSDLLRTYNTAGQSADRPDSAPTTSSDERLPELILTRDEEQALLREANQAGTPTLAPQNLQEADLLPSVPVAASETWAGAPTSFTGEIIAFVRRNPLPALLTGVGLAYMLTRRRR